MRYLRWSLFSVFASVAICVSAFTGSWRGDLNLGNAVLPLVFNFSEVDDQTLCTFDSPKQGAFGLRAEVEFCSSDSVSVLLKNIGAKLTGRYENDVIKGIFEQRGFQFPITLNRELPLLERRPQTPVAPFPYESVDTVFIASDGKNIAGTLILPDQRNGGDVPMVVMVTGSGAQNRDEEIFGHKPFAVIADYLGRHGIASFRYDDRGVGKSEGDFSSSTTYTFKDDAEGALKFVKSLKSIGKVGMIGHSEGGTIAFLLAADDKMDFMISLAGMAVSGKETILAQNLHLMQKMGMDKEMIKPSMKLIESVFDKMISQIDSNMVSPIDVDAIAKGIEGNISPFVMQSLKQNVAKRSKWFDTFISIDPSKNIGNITMPVLALNGSKDTQVDAAKNLEVIREKIGNAEIHELEGLNHMFQHAETGEVDEYEQIRETIYPEVLNMIVDFILK